MSICSEEKKKLIEEIGLMFEEKHNFPPLAARIYGTLILSNKEGHSFDDLLKISEASKSSISTNLNLLTQMNYVEYYTKPGDRKRYFKVSKNNLRISLQDQLQELEEELKLIKKINAFNSKNNPEKYETNKSIGGNYQNYLIQHQEILTQTIDKMIAFEKTQSDK